MQTFTCVPLFIKQVQMYCRSGTGVRCCISARRRGLRVYSSGGGTFLRKMTSWPPSWNYDVKSKIRLRHRCVFTWRSFPPNFIPIRFETTLPRRDRNNKKNKNKMSNDMRSVPDLKRTLALERQKEQNDHKDIIHTPPNSIDACFVHQLSR